MREEIEVFGEHHLDGCAGLYASVFSSEPWDEPWITERARERLAQIYHTPAFEGLVCTVNGEPVGLVMGNCVRRAAGRGFMLHELCAGTGVQGTGIGRRLLSSLEERLRERGVGSVLLLTGRDVPAKSFYAKNGYEEVTDMIAMIKAL